MQYFQNQRQQHSTLALSTFSALPPILLLRSPTVTVTWICMYLCVCMLSRCMLSATGSELLKKPLNALPSLPPSPTPESYVWFYGETKVSSCSRYLIQTPEAFLPFSPTDFEVFCMVLPWCHWKACKTEARGEGLLSCLHASNILLIWNSLQLCLDNTNNKYNVETAWVNERVG